MSKMLNKLRIKVADSSANVWSRDVIGNKEDAAAAGAVSTTESIMAYVKQLITDTITNEAKEVGPFTVVKSDGAVLTGDDDLFVISGGPVLAKIRGRVTTIIGGASNGDLQIDVTDPEATVDLNAAPVAIDTDAVATEYLCLDSTSVFTPVTAGSVIIDVVAVPETLLYLTPGTVIFRSSAAQTGVIEWSITYEKVLPTSLVVAAA